ncbi:ester cyclase [Cribrihabitans neustonicus]|uniref:ester cyclase n=1 Tax=Cribrihabitans neustonicus TaxID=1429085 RepID=UPI003B596891
MTNSKAELLQNWYDRAWRDGDLSAIDETFLPGTSASGVVPSLQLSRADFEAFLDALRNLMRNIKVTIVQSMEQGDWLAARLLLSGESAGTGVPVSATGQVMLQFRGGKIAATYGQLDYFTLFEQLGQLPADALPICLTGQRLDWA